MSLNKRDDKLNCSGSAAVRRGLRFGKNEYQYDKYVRIRKYILIISDYYLTDTLQELKYIYTYVITYEVI